METIDDVSAGFRVRTATVSGTGRTSFRFDAATWAAIDMLAEKEHANWSEWAARAIDARPHAKSKASAVRAAVTDALLADQFTTMAAEAGAGPVGMVDHPVVGSGYYRLDDKTLAIELEGAEVVTQDDAFEGFTLLVGYRDKAFGGAAFVCVQNRLKGGLHLFIAKE